MRLARRHMIAWGAAALLASPSYAQSAPMPIYGDALAPGWSNWSWATVVLSADISAPDGARPIAVEAGPWTALYLQHADFSTRGFSTLSFWIHGGATGGQTLSVVAVVGGNPRTENYFRVVPEAGRWTRIEVPLSALGAADRMVGGFWIQNGSAAPAARFYVNQIALY